MKRPAPGRFRTLARFAACVLVVLAGDACHKRAPAPAAASAASTEAPPAPPKAPTCTLTAEPATVDQGHSVVLSWTSQDATSVDIEPGVGKQLAKGSTSVTPKESTTYVLTASGPGGDATCTSRVTVAMPPPPPTPSVKEENLETNLADELRDAYFDYDKADLRPDAEQALTADAAVLKAHPDIRVTVEGHCDERGSEEYNLGLGDRRATAAQNFLESLGVSADRLRTVSYGKSRPVCTESTEECWQKNRRAHLSIKSGPQQP